MSTTETPKESRSLKILREIFDSGRPLAYVKSPEEQRIAQLLLDAAALYFPTPPAVWSWSLTEGLQRSDGTPAPGDTRDPRTALDFVIAHDGPALFQFKDFHEAMRDSAEIRRRLRDVAEECFDRSKYLIVSSPVQFIPEELNRSMVFLELTVPDVIELTSFLEREAAAIRASGGSVDTEPATLHQLARALLGLTIDEARYAVRRALAESNNLGSHSLAALLEEKRLLVNRSGLIQFVAQQGTIEDVGGLEVMKKWLLERRRLFLMRDDISSDIVPKGVLVMGVSGCGKSLSVKAIASCFELPLYRIDMTEIFSGRYGAAEGAFARACRILEQIAPAVVWFDEIEMGITSTESSGEQGRLFAFFLTWMQEKAKGLFVAATANRIDLLPAEMIRKGRFDEVFFVDLPIDDERVDIFRIHLLRRGVDPSGYNLERLKRFTKGWTGAEVEQCVVSAMTTAKLEDRALNEDDLLNSTANIVPLSKTMKEQVDQIRAWAFDRAVRASPREGGR